MGTEVASDYRTELTSPRGASCRGVLLNSKESIHSQIVSSYPTPDAFSRSSTRDRLYEGWPSALVRLEQCGLVCGPAAYAVSRRVARVIRPRNIVTSPCAVTAWAP
jgi:hypothetical protein